jgi:hypothetical protein
MSSVAEIQEVKEERNMQEKGTVSLMLFPLFVSFFLPLYTPLIPFLSLSTFLLLMFSFHLLLNLKKHTLYHLYISFFLSFHIPFLAVSLIHPFTYAIFVYCFQPAPSRLQFCLFAASLYPLVGLLELC